MGILDRLRQVELTAFAIRDFRSNEYLKERRDNNGKARMQFDPVSSDNYPRLYSTERAAKIALTNYTAQTGRYLKIETVRIAMPK